MTALLYLLFLIAVFTASFDLIGVLDLAGGNLRITNLAMALFGAGGLVIAAARGYPRVRSFWWLALWTIANLVCMINAPRIFRTYAYAIWLIVDVVFIFTLSATFRGPGHVRRMAQLNYWSYVFVAVFGLLQFALFAGGIEVLVKQAWTGRFARINGFSYEPSYYATYLITGWCVAFYLLLRPVSFFGARTVWITFGLLSLAMILCSSRMGYFGMVVMFLFMLPRVLQRLLGAGKWGVLALVALGFGAIVGATIVARTITQADLSIVLEGTGAAGTHAHSVDQRLAKLTKYKDLLVAHPFRGYSLGGIAGVVAGAGGVESVDYEALRKAQGMNVSFEIVLATGIGLAPLFFIYFYLITAGLVVRAFASADPDLVILTKANAWGLLIQFLLLQFNQNILRNYFWIQIAVVSCLATEIAIQHRAAAPGRRV